MEIYHVINLISNLTTLPSRGNGLSVGAAESPTNISIFSTYLPSRFFSHVTDKKQDVSFLGVEREHFLFLMNVVSIDYYFVDGSVDIPFIVVLRYILRDLILTLGRHHNNPLAKSRSTSLLPQCSGTGEHSGSLQPLVESQSRSDPVQEGAPWHLEINK